MNSRVFTALLATAMMLGHSSRLTAQNTDAGAPVPSPAEAARSIAAQRSEEESGPATEAADGAGTSTVQAADGNAEVEVPAPPPDTSSTTEPMIAPDAIPDPTPPLPPPPADPPIERVEADAKEDEETPRWRLRIAGGASFATAGSVGPYLRAGQELEWLPPDLEFILVGLGLQQTSDLVATTLVQAGVRVGGFSEIGHWDDVRCLGAIMLQVGGMFASRTDFDISADADLRFLFGPLVELTLRGGFFTYGSNSLVSVSLALAAAF